MECPHTELQIKYYFRPCGSVQFFNMACQLKYANEIEAYSKFWSYQHTFFFKSAHFMLIPSAQTIMHWVIGISRTNLMILRQKMEVEKKVIFFIFLLFFFAFFVLLINFSQTFCMSRWGEGSLLCFYFITCFRAFWTLLVLAISSVEKN